MNLRTLGPIGHCSAQVRRLLAIQEEEALRWKVRVRVDRDQEKKPSPGSRFTIAPCFDVPGPFGSPRPLSPGGRVTFHFSEQTVTKLANGGSQITTASGHKRLAANAASKHDAYVARPEAVLTISSAQFGSYAERGSAVEVEADKPAVFSNISDDPDIRRTFWLAVHKHERSAQPDRLVFHRDRLSPESWRALGNASELPASVRDIVTALAKPSARKSKKKGDASIEIDAIEGHKVCRLMQELFHGVWSRSRPPVRIAKGRNGRTQFRLTAEFPLGLDAAARVRITRKFCGEFEKLGAMFTAAIHAPDEHNDERNHHLHLAYYDRPCAIVPEIKKWDFEICEKVEGQHNRYRYPYRQPKISELGRDPSGGGYRKYRASTIYRWRERFAELCNEELARAGISRLFDPRKYSEMGIKQEPTQPLGRNAAPLEAAGVPTATGCRNAEIIWTAMLTAAREADDQQRAARRRQLKRALDAADRLAAAGLIGERNSLLAKAEEIDRLSTLLADHELEISELRITLEMAYARPDKAIDTCSRLLTAIEAGRGTRSDRANQNLIGERKAAAEDFVQTIDDVRDQSMASIAPTLDQVGAARLRIGTLFNEIEPIVAEAFKRQPAVPPKQEAMADKVTGEIDASRCAIDTILDRILSEDRPVFSPDDQVQFYHVPGISREEFRLLTASRTWDWVQSRLEGIAQIQRTRMFGAARALNKFGRTGLERLAQTNSDLRRAVKWADAYSDHPTFRDFVKPAALPSPSPAAPHQATPTDVSQNEDEPQPTTRRSLPVDAHATEPMIKRVPATFRLPDGHGDKEREEAVQAYAAAITNEPNVLVVTINGEPRIDASSIPEWQISASSFEEEITVKQAIKKRQAANRDRERALDRQKIILELRASERRPLERIGDRWFITHISDNLKNGANEWQVHPELSEAYEQLDQLWTGRELYGAAAQITERNRDGAGAIASVRSRDFAESQEYSLEQQASYHARVANRTR